MRRRPRVSRALPLALLLAAAPESASAQVFFGSRPHTPLTVGPLTVQATLTPALGPITVEVLFSILVPPGRTPTDLEQDLYVLWPAAARGVREPRDPALAKFVEARGLSVIDEGALPMFARNLYAMGGGVRDIPLPGAAYVTFVHDNDALGLSAPGTWIRIRWTPKLVNRALTVGLRLTVDDLVRPEAGNWLDRVFAGPRHRVVLAFHDVGGRAVFPLYVEHRDRALRLSNDPAQVVLNFAEAPRLKIDSLAPPGASRRLSDVLDATETVSLFLERAEGVTPQTLAVRFGYFSGLQSWGPVLIPFLFFVAGNVAAVLVRNGTEYLSRRLAGRLTFGRAAQPAERQSGVIVPRETLATIAPGETTVDELVRVVGASPEEYERLDGSGRRTLTWRGRRLVPRLRRRLGWFSTVSHWDAEDHEVEIEIDGDRVRDVQARIRRARVDSPR
jgi:hypothetical protein